MKYTFHLIACFIFCLLPVVIFGQNANLVENPGFESDTFPVIQSWPRQNTVGREVVSKWVTPTPATPDYYNSNQSVCDGYPIALAHSGQGRAALICGMENMLPGVTNYKEYIQGHLKSALKSGQRYKLRYYIALDCSNNYTSTGIGAYFSENAFRSDSKEKLNYKPQIISYQHITYADGWVEMYGEFTAKGGERFITIGSYSDTSIIPLSQYGQEAMTSLSTQHIRPNVYFYLDDVCLTEIENEDCSCKKKKETTHKEEDIHYFLFVLDISNSMNESGKIKLMRKQIRRFADSLNSTDKIGILTFADGTRMILPFSSPEDGDRIESCMDKLEAKGGTNGDYVMRKIASMLDSLKRHNHCHVIFATDGIFEISKKSKQRIDSSLVRNKASFCVLQLGEIKNADLEEIALAAPGGSYHFADRKNLPDILERQLPDEPEESPSPKGEVETVYYTRTEYMAGKDYIEFFLKGNPSDHFHSIPRK
jgi:von Willebrand factor type A domain